VAALLGTHEEVLQVERRAPEERRVREVVEREADRAPAAPADQRLEVAARPEAVPAEPRGRGRQLVGEAFVLGEAADEPEDRRDVAPRGRSAFVWDSTCASGPWSTFTLLFDFTLIFES